MKSNKLDVQGKITPIKIMKSDLKVIPFCLWEQQFCRASNSLNIPNNIIPYSNPSTLGFQKIDINKIYLHTGKIGTGKKK